MVVDKDVCERGKSRGEAEDEEAEEEERQYTESKTRTPHKDVRNNALNEGWRETLHHITVHHIPIHSMKGGVRLYITKQKQAVT